MRCEYEALCGMGLCDILLHCEDFRHMSKKTQIKVDAQYKKDDEWLRRHNGKNQNR